MWLLHKQTWSCRPFRTGDTQNGVSSLQSLCQRRFRVSVDSSKCCLPLSHILSVSLRYSTRIRACSVAQRTFLNGLSRLVSSLWHCSDSSTFFSERQRDWLSGCRDNVTGWVVMAGVFDVIHQWWLSFSGIDLARHKRKRCMSKHIQRFFVVIWLKSR